MEYISNNQYKNIIRIISNSHYRKKQQKVFVEGINLVNELIKNKKDLIDYVVVTEKSQNKIIGVQKYLVKESGVSRLSSRISGFEAAAIVNTKPIVDISLPDNIQGLYLGLLEVQDPFNLGTIFRTAEAFNVKGIFIFSGTVDPLNQKALDTSVGSVLRVPFYNVKNENDFFNKYKNTQIIGTSVEKAINYKNAVVKKSAILLFGNEGRGLSKYILNKTDFNINIPISNIDSLNLAVSAGIITSYICSEFK